MHVFEISYISRGSKSVFPENKQENTFYELLNSFQYRAMEELRTSVQIFLCPHLKPNTIQMMNHFSQEERQYSSNLQAFKVSKSVLHRKTKCTEFEESAMKC